MSNVELELSEMCNVCSEELFHGEVGRCDRCQRCPFCSSNFTITSLNVVAVERRCMKCNAYTETYLDN